MNQKTISPEITSFEWGELQTIDNSYKDAKLYPGGSRVWDWNETGTSHIPGILPADIEELLEHDAEVIILSKGINERLRTSREAKIYLDKKEVEYFILQSEKAVAKYNQLRTIKAVGALIHSTC